MPGATKRCEESGWRARLPTWMWRTPLLQQGRFDCADCVLLQTRRQPMVPSQTEVLRRYALGFANWS